MADLSVASVPYWLLSGWGVLTGLRQRAGWVAWLQAGAPAALRVVVARARVGEQDKGRRFALAGTDQSPLSQAIRARGRYLRWRSATTWTTSGSKSAPRPGVVHGHGHAEIDRLRAELEELTGKRVVLNMLDPPGPRERPGDAGSGHTAGPTRP